jgi:hypothetical protein
MNDVEPNLQWLNSEAAPEYHGLVLRPSCVPENVGMNQK